MLLLLGRDEERRRRWASPMVVERWWLVGESWKWGGVGEGLTIWERREKGGRALFLLPCGFTKEEKKREKKRPNDLVLREACT